MDENILKAAIKSLQRLGVVKSGDVVAQGVVNTFSKVYVSNEMLLSALSPYMQDKCKYFELDEAKGMIKVTELGIEALGINH